jgi:hypothetical protein
VIAGPLYGEEGMLLADCDLREVLHAKRWFDSVGHYSREDVLLGEIESGAAVGPQEGSSSNSSSPTATSSPRSKPAR